MVRKVSVEHMDVVPSAVNKESGTAKPVEAYKEEAKKTEVGRNKTEVGPKIALSEERSEIKTTDRKAPDFLKPLPVSEKPRIMELREDMSVPLNIPSKTDITDMHSEKTETSAADTKKTENTTVSFDKSPAQDEVLKAENKMPAASRAKPQTAEQLTIETADLNSEKKPKKPLFRVIGTLFNTYILIELEDSMIMIDQHAAHERLMYEKFTARMNMGETASQALMIPVIIPVSAHEMALIEENMPALEKVGYEVEPFGDRSISVRAVPFIMGHADIKPIFMDMLGSLDRIGAAAMESRANEIAVMACKAAVKAGDKLTDSEISSLIEQMLETGAPPTCPHGRPVSKTLTKRDIEKLFKRIQ